MTKATLINQSGQKVVVDSGTPQAQQYFSQGYSLMGAQTPKVNTPAAPAGSVAIPGAQYNTQALQQANFSNIQPVGNTLYGVPKVAEKLTSDQLTGGTPAVTPVTPTPTTSATGTVASATEYMNQLNADLQAQREQQAQAEAQRAAGTQKLTDLYEQLGQKGTEYTTELEKYNYGANVTQLQDVNKQIASLTAAFNQRIVDNQGRPVLSAIIGGQESLINRQKAAEVGGLSAIAQALQGNITLAQQTAKDAIDVKYDPIETQIQAQKDQLDYIYKDLSRADQLKADTQKSALDERLRQIEEQKTEESNVSNIALTLAQKGADTNTINAVRNAKTLNEAVLIASGATPILTPDGLKGLTENNIIRIDGKIYKRGKNWLAETTDTTPQKIGTDASGNDIFYDPVTSSIKTADQLTGTANLGSQVGTISGLPSYDTRTANPGVSRSDRNNNPGNIKVSNFTKDWEGVIGVESTPAQDGGNFLIFDSPESGINAIGKLLLTSGYSGMTAEKAIKRYNGNGSYGAASVGLDPNKDFQSQIQDPVKLQQVASAIAKAEGFTGSGKSYDMSTIKTVDELEPLVKNLAQQIIEGTQKFSDIKGLTTQETARLKQEVTNAIPLIKAQKAEEANDTKVTARTLIKELKESPALEMATGASSWMTKIPGTQSYEFKRKVDQLKALLTGDNLGKLKGPMSDKDIKFLENMSTSLSLGLSTTSFVSELDKILERLGGEQSNMNTSKTTVEQIAGSGNKINISDLNFKF